MPDYWEWWNKYYKENDMSKSRNKHINTVHELTKIGWDAAIAAIEEERKQRSMSKRYQDECYCDNCQADTKHDIYESGHERDGSNDSRTCLICGWWYSGYTGNYEPPLSTDETK